MPFSYSDFKTILDDEGCGSFNSFLTIRRYGSTRSAWSLVLFWLSWGSSGSFASYYYTAALIHVTSFLWIAAHDAQICIYGQAVKHFLNKDTRISAWTLSQQLHLNLSKVLTTWLGSCGQFQQMDLHYFTMFYYLRLFVTWVWLWSEIDLLWYCEYSMKNML